MCKQYVFCCACPLATGAKVSAKVTGIYIILLSTAIAFYAMNPDVKLPTTNIKVVDFKSPQILAVAGVFLAVLIITTIGLVYLILGILQGRPEFILIWLIINFFQIGIGLAAAIFAILGGDVVSIPVAITAIILIYLWVITLNYYYDFTRDEEASEKQRLCCD